jgi:hypothetical protein
MPAAGRAISATQKRCSPSFTLLCQTRNSTVPAQLPIDFQSGIPGSAERHDGTLLGSWIAKAARRESDHVFELCLGHRRADRHVTQAKTDADLAKYSRSAGKQMHVLNRVDDARRTGLVGSFGGNRPIDASFKHLNSTDKRLRVSRGRTSNRKHCQHQHDGMGVPTLHTLALLFAPAGIRS